MMRQRRLFLILIGVLFALLVAGCEPTETPTPTPTATVVLTKPPTATLSPTPPPTRTAEPTVTPTLTSTPSPIPTDTAVPPTPTPTASPTTPPTKTAEPTSTATSTPTNTPSPVPTDTAVPPTPTRNLIRLESELWFDDPEMAKGWERLACVVTPTVRLEHSWKVVQDGTAVISDTWDVPGMIPPSELGAGQFDGPIVFYVDGNRFSGTASVLEKFRWIVEGECYKIVGNVAEPLGDWSEHWAMKPTGTQDADGYWFMGKIEGTQPTQAASWTLTVAWMMVGFLIVMGITLCGVVIWQLIARYNKGRI
jgi:hypothetical protein